MKNKIFSPAIGHKPFAIIFALALSFSSCETDILEEDPRTVAVEVYYNTAEEVETAVNAIYSRLRIDDHAIYIGFLDIHTDFGYGRGSYAQVNDFQGLNATNINRVGAFWNMFYLTVRNANLVIENAPNGTDINQADIDRFLAEAKFLRALAYFHLVRNWGEVPLRTESNMLQRDLEKSSVEEIYALIIADLEEAETNLPLEPTHIGRPSIWAAKTLLADVYLFREMYAQARDKAKEVMDSNVYSLVPVSNVENFQNIFGPDVLTTQEEIFNIQFAREIGHGNYLPWILNHPSTGLYSFGGSYAHYGDSADPFYTNWDDNDLRKGLWDIVDFGMGSTTMVSRKFIDPLAIGNNDAGNNLPVYRFSEILLIYSEAAARLANGPTEEAMEAVNMVHRRAYGEDPESPSSFDLSTQSYNLNTFLDLIIQERSYEFIFEGKHWLTLKRMGLAEETLLENRGINIAEIHYLWPIPVSELNYNEALDPVVDQNPGY